MGSLQPGPAGLPDQGASIDSLADLASWLDGLMTTLASGGIALECAEETVRRLKETPFGEVLSAIGRARPGPGSSVEIAFYHHWIDANTDTSPLLYAAWFNVGVLHAHADDNKAAAAYGKALALRPDLHVAAINLGLVLEADGQPEQALATWQRATQPDAARVLLEIQQGRLLEKLGRFEEAERILYRVLLTDPAQPDVVHHLVYLRQKMCQWPVASSNIPGIPPVELVRNSSPLSILIL
jgi:predicted O-linked N-acetylglucosamine transferase (SPINDLY family)